MQVEKILTDLFLRQIFCKRFLVSVAELRKGKFMDELKDFEEMLVAVKKIGEKLQAERNFLAEENSELRAENQRILAERNNLLVELNSLLAENERLRKVNESFGDNLRQINDLFRMFIGGSKKILNDSENVENSIVPTETEPEILDAEENLPVSFQENSPKKKMVYAEFYAEEVGFKED